MTGWVMVIIVIASTGATSTSVYFSDEDACKESAAVLTRALRADPSKTNFQIACLPRKKP